MRAVTVMLIGGGGGGDVPGLQPPHLIKATGLNGPLAPWVTDRESRSHSSPHQLGHINCRLPPWTEVFVVSGVSTGGDAS